MTAQDELRFLRKLQGLCVQCGAPRDRRGLVCNRCNDANNVSKWLYHQRMHDEGKCTQCLKPLDREGWFCSECCQTMKYKSRELVMERRAKGLCPQCGKPHEPGRIYCRKCLDARMDRYWKKKGNTT